MKKLVLAVTWLCVASGAVFAALPDPKSIPYSEVEHLMGSCYSQGLLTQDVCSGVCGTKTVQAFVTGSNSLADAVPCGATSTCTARQNVTSNACAG